MTLAAYSSCILDTCSLQQLQPWHLQPAVSIALKIVVHSRLAAHSCILDIIVAYNSYRLDTCSLQQLQPTYLVSCSLQPIPSWHLDYNLPTWHLRPWACILGTCGLVPTCLELINTQRVASFWACMFEQEFLSKYIWSVHLHVSVNIGVVQWAFWVRFQYEQAYTRTVYCYGNTFNWIYPYSVVMQSAYCRLSTFCLHLLQPHQKDILCDEFLACPQTCTRDFVEYCTVVFSQATTIGYAIFVNY